MSLEAAAVAVGRAVGKQLVVAWVGEQQAERRRDAELSELIQVRFPDRLVRRRLTRQIDDVADQVAERLLALCGHEYRGLRKNDEAAALTAVADTLAAADLSDQELFAADVDAARVAGRVRAGRSGRAVEQDLGEAGRGSTTWCSRSAAAAWCGSSSNCPSTGRGRPHRRWPG
jgi:hypothetical protein